MNNKITRFIFGIHAISNIISSDENKIKKIYFKKKVSSKNLSLLYKKSLESGLLIEEVDTDKLTMLCDTPKHQGVVCEIEDADLSSFDLDN